MTIPENSEIARVSALSILELEVLSHYLDANCSLLGSSAYLGQGGCELTSNVSIEQDLNFEANRRGDSSSGS